MQERSASELIDEYIARGSRSLKVAEGLESSEAWRLIVEDQLENIKKIDANWQYILKSDEKRLDDLRIMKMASLTIVNLLDSYKEDVKKCNFEAKNLKDLEGEDDGE